MSAPAPILVARDLVKHFPVRKGLFGRVAAQVKAVDGVSLEIAPGETLALVGESGCGKSTLGRMLLRLIDPTSGTISFMGEDLTRLGEAEMRARRRHMQIVFQDPYASLNPRMTVADIVGEPLKLHGIVPPAGRAARIAELLSLVGLKPEHARRYPHEFSGGQRQRIGIARALASGPKLVIGDEPVSALDVSIRAQVINLLEDLKARLGLTLILVAHDLAVIRHTADRVAVMYLGEIVELAPTDGLYDTPMHPYTRALMQAIPVPRPPVEGQARTKPLLEGDPPSPANPPSGCRFHTRCPHARPRCRTERPALRSVRPGQSAACHFAEEIAAAETAAIALPPASDALRRRLALFAAAQAAPSQATSAKEAPR
jgi:oligopeptide/dipeptide ABC transporter ATP-binding protein